MPLNSKCKTSDCMMEDMNDSQQAQINAKQMLAFGGKLSMHCIGLFRWDMSRTSMGFNNS